MDEPITFTESEKRRLKEWVTRAVGVARSNAIPISKSNEHQALAAESAAELEELLALYQKIKAL